MTSFGAGGEIPIGLWGSKMRWAPDVQGRGAKRMPRAGVGRRRRAPLAVAEPLSRPLLPAVGANLDPVLCDRVCREDLRDAGQLSTLARGRCAGPLLPLESPHPGRDSLHLCPASYP